MRLQQGKNANWSEIWDESYELAAACIQTNYYGAKRTNEALLPLLQLSDSPRIANISSRMGRLKVQIPRHTTCICMPDIFLTF